MPDNETRHKKDQTPEYAVVFDAGNTIINVNPEYTGPMVNWPTLETPDHLHEKLEILTKKYPLFIASNAQDSDAQMARAALKRVGLDKYFQEIFCSRDLGFQKPDLQFFKLIENRISKPASEIIMIGDSYPKDILGAWESNWKSLWFNSQIDTCPASLAVHDMEFSNYKELDIDLIEQTPSWKTSHLWLMQNNIVQNLYQHINLVAVVSYLLAILLKKQGIDVNPILAHRGGLLHDLKKLDRSQSEKDFNHGERAARFLDKKGYPVLANIARKHVLSCIEDDRLSPETWEEKIVYYADKLVFHNRIATIEERLADLQNRYGFSKDYSASIKFLENEILLAAEIDLQDLFSWLNSICGFKI